MTYGHPQHWVETPYDTRSYDFELNVEPAERVGPPLRRRSKAALRGLFVATVLTAGAGFYLAADPASNGLLASATSFFDMAFAKARDVAARFDHGGAAEPEIAPDAFADVGAPLAPFGQGAPETVAALPEMEPAHAEGSPSADADVASTESLGAAYTEAAEPAKETEDKSPQRKRAIDAGLGPDLPNILLSRLSKADLKNAEYAIKTALAKTADDAKFSWPPKPSKEQASFEVRFAEGAAPGCRRYVVTVTKDRWTSTSAALERCGDATVHARAG